MKILKKKKKKKIFFFVFVFFEIGNFFFKLGKTSPKSHWERGRISAPEHTQKNPCPGTKSQTILTVLLIIQSIQDLTKRQDVIILIDQEEIIAMPTHHCMSKREHKYIAVKSYKQPLIIKKYKICVFRLLQVCFG